MYTISLGKVTSVEECSYRTQAHMMKVNGKPYLRMKIRLRVIVWWPFCDLKKNKSYPCPGRGDHRRTRRIKIFHVTFCPHREKLKHVTFPMERLPSGDPPFLPIMPIGPPI